MKSALRVGEARQGTFQVVTTPRVQAIEEIPLAERSHLGNKVSAGKFVTMVEIVPPKGVDVGKEVDGAQFLKSVGVDAVNIPDSPRASARMSNQALSLIIQQQVGIEPVLHYTCRDRNVLSIQSDLLGASAIAIRRSWETIQTQRPCSMLTQSDL
jgi:homocysteine S-methyltransferase